MLKARQVSDSGWFHDGEICFTSEIYPSELEDVFVSNPEDNDDEGNTEEYNGSEIYSNDESDDEF